MQPKRAYDDLIAEARIADHAGMWEQSISCYRSAARAATSRELRSYALHNAAISCRRAGDVDRALRFLLMASTELEDTETPSKAEIELAVGNTLVDAGLLADAVPHLRSAIELFSSSGRHEERLFAEIGLGRAFALQGHLDQAEERFRAAVEFSHSDELKSQGFHNLGVLRRLQGRLEDAVEFFQRDIELCDLGGDSHGQAVALMSLSRLEQSRGRIVEAIALIERALALFQQSNSRLEADRATDELRVLRSAL